MLKYNLKRTIELDDWDKLVTETYGRPYSFQQQDGCRDRGTYGLTVPDEDICEDDYIDVSEVSDSEKELMGVKFADWLSRDPKTLLKNQEYAWELELFWERKFYPIVEMVANDLYKKGLIEAGEYRINIDW